MSSWSWPEEEEERDMREEEMERDSESEQSLRRGREASDVVLELRCRNCFNDDVDDLLGFELNDVAAAVLLF